jgi:hypothetical protein
MKLREKIYKTIGKAKAESIMNEKQVHSRGFFLAALKNPSNLVVDDSTSAFLKSLQKNLLSHGN